MRFIKNNLKPIITFFIGMIIASSVTVLATGYFAKDVTYKDNKSVEDALNDLYTKCNGKLELYDSGSSIGTSSSSNRTVSKMLEKGKYIIVLSESSANPTNNQSVSIILNNNTNSVETLKFEKNVKNGVSYSSANAVGTFYVEIEEEETITLAGNDSSDSSSVGAVFIYQIFKI